MDAPEQTCDLTPWGSLLSGQAGVSAARIAKRLGVAACHVKRIASPIGRMKMPYRNAFNVYDPALVNQLDQHPEIVAARQRSRRARESRDARRQQRFDHFSHKYPTWQAALLDACEALFNLNRYAKHASCSAGHKQAIYELKTRLVQLLCVSHLCTDCWQHTVELKPKLCFACDGSGDLWDGPCWKCNGTGQYKPPTTLKYICFRFEIHSHTYCWHQPERLVNFPVHFTAQPSGWDYTVEEKPVALSKTEFATAKDLLRWTLKQAESQGVIPPPSDETEPPHRQQAPATTSPLPSPNS